MSVLCRAFGHEASRRGVQLDPQTFAVHSHCRRCRLPLVRDGAHGWKVVAEEDSITVAA
jgi:hypothetical protein